MQRLLSFCLCLASCLCGAEELRWGYSPSNGMPYAESIDHELAPGFIRDLGETVGQRLGLEVRFVETPDKRIETALAQGSIDLLCINNPQWMKAPAKLHWSPGLFEEEDVLAFRTDAPPMDDLEALNGTRLGTSLGYIYPNRLMQAFAEGRIQRTDARDLDTRLHMLEHRRLDALIDMRRPLEFLVAEHVNLPVAVSRKGVQRYSIYCSYGPALPVPADRLDAVLQTLVDDGAIQRLLGEQSARLRQRR
ncbi:transporter substrate-binding domain-containing protein [Pseudomonas sp. PDNC002]|uniref:substrate-binding periplasmic protein n=1 Tax=Pseudomonas sp. PDNC002 TaxID=2811422 RepID=UPI001F06D2EA|nr:transporter substrate-binding domain-containing protein [Pseudomonas sp. PDNC002]